MTLAYPARVWKNEGCKNLLTQKNCLRKDDWIDIGTEFD